MTQTSKLPKIKIMGAKNERTFIPLTHNVYATQKVGKITPYMCRFMDPNSKAKIKLETLEYNAPMVAPTVGILDNILAKDGLSLSRPTK